MKGGPGSQDAVGGRSHRCRSPTCLCPTSSCGRLTEAQSRFSLYTNWHGEAATPGCIRSAGRTWTRRCLLPKWTAPPRVWPLTSAHMWRYTHIPAGTRPISAPPLPLSSHALPLLAPTQHPPAPGLCPLPGPRVCRAVVSHQPHTAAAAAGDVAKGAVTRHVEQLHAFFPECLDCRCTALLHYWCTGLQVYWVTCGLPTGAGCAAAPDPQTLQRRQLPPSPYYPP